MNPYDQLIEKIESGRAQPAIIGLGYVGLPEAMAACEAGYRVIGYDVDAEKVERLRAGESYVRDISSDEVARWLHADRFEPTTDPDRLAEADSLHLCVPTPLNKTGDPDVSYLIDATETVARRLRSGQLVVLESTTYPGTTRELLLPGSRRRGCAPARTSSSSSVRSGWTRGTPATT